MESRLICAAVVTGPTGAIGQALCRTLLSRSVRVYAVCRPDSPRAKTLPKSENLTIVPRCMEELTRLPEQIPEKTDAFFHLAWAKTTGAGRNDMPAQINNIRYTVDAVRAAAALGCRVFVGAGSQAEYGRVNGPLRPDTPCFPENGYGMAKLCAGQMSRTECALLGLDHIWMRILSVYGPFDGENSMISTVIRSLLAGKKPSLTAGEQLWDYLYSEDAAEALCLAAEKGRSGAVYPLGSGKARPLLDYVEELRDVIDPTLPLGFGEIPYGEKQVMHLEADISALCEDTGFMPETSFAEGIQKTIQWMEDR